LRIESYFQEIQTAIEKCPIGRITHVSFEKRSTHTGLIDAEITFIDESILKVREFIDVESSVDRLMYAYQLWTHRRNSFLGTITQVITEKRNYPLIPTISTMEVKIMF
jgi:hypothetical protein